MLGLLKKILFVIFFIPKNLFKAREKGSNFSTNFVSFFVLSFMCLYYGSLYYFTPFDKSWMTVLSPESSLKNPFGEIGSFASGLVFFYFGLASWILPGVFFPFVLPSLLKRESTLFLFKFFVAWSVLLASSLFLLSSYKVIYVVEGIDFLAGGVWGLALMEWFFKIWGNYGSHLLVFLLLWLSFSFMFNISFLSPKIPSFFIWFFRFFLSKCKNFYLFLLNLRKAKNLHKEEKNLVIKNLEKPASYEEKREEKLYKKPKPLEEKLFKSLREIFKKKSLSAPKDDSEDIETGELILKTFEEFGLKGKILDYARGPSLVTYNFQPEEGIRQAKVYSLVDDLALALKVQCVMIKPARDKRALGIQVPRKKPELVSLGDILKDDVYVKNLSPLALAFGLSEKGEPICEDLSSMPHILIAGSTGSGKSVCLNAFICSILAKASPSDVRFLMIDPKMLELSVYNEIPHLLAPVVTTDLNKAKACLNWAVYEMDRRYSLMEKVGVRDLSSYNRKIKLEKENISQNHEEKQDESLPSIVVIIDELADLMLMAAKDIEQLIQRLTQKARACGIHLILATQRPSVDVVTGIIKANLPCRLSFRVVSRYDSKTILDQNDAEKLLGRGDMFFMKPGSHGLQRIQGAFVSEEEIKSFVQKLKTIEGFYDESVMEWINANAEEGGVSSRVGGKSFSGSFDELYNEAKEVARSHGLVSTSFLQRHLGLGYNRAAKIIDKMEEEALITGPDGSKKRKWLKED